jgi:hypothetical protein
MPAASLTGLTDNCIILVAAAAAAPYQAQNYYGCDSNDDDIQACDIVVEHICHLTYTVYYEKMKTPVTKDAHAPFCPVMLFFAGRASFAGHINDKYYKENMKSNLRGNKNGPLYRKTADYKRKSSGLRLPIVIRAEYKEPV